MTLSLTAMPEIDRHRLIVLFTSGTGGDLQPFMHIQAGLHARGHRTLLLIPAFHEARVRDAGLPYQTFGTADQFQAVLADPDLWEERKGFGVVWRGLLPHALVFHEWLAALPQDESCVVLSHPFLAPIAALGRSLRPHLHVVGVYLAPSSLRSVHDPLSIGSLTVAKWVPLSWRRALWSLVDRIWMDPELLPGLNAARRSVQLPPVEKHFLLNMQASCNASVGLFPAWFAPSPPDWPRPYWEGGFPLQPVPLLRALPNALERFLAEGEAPIVFTAGTGHQHARKFYETALAVLRKLGRRGLFITTHAEQIPSGLPPEILWQAFAPFDVLLPRVAAIVHHGGIGTTAEALRAGVPQLILPFAFDQFDNGRRVSDLGVGKCLHASRLNARRLSQKLTDVLALEIRSQAKKISVQMGLNDRADSEQLIERVLAALAVH